MKTICFLHFFSQIFQTYAIIYKLKSDKSYSNNQTLAVNKHFNYFYLEIPFGWYRRQNMLVRLDTGSIVLWVPSVESNFNAKPKYNITESDTYQSTGNTINVDSLVNGIISHETISFDTLMFFHFEWILATEYTSSSVSNCSGIMGFSRGVYDPYSTNQSLLEQLKNKIFTIDIVNNSYYIQTGERTESFDNNFDKRGHCTMRSETNVSWECRMSHIIFGEVSNDTFKANSFSLYQEAIFDTGNITFVFPIEYINLFNYMMNKHNAECNYDREKKGTKTITCNKTDNVPDFSFVFNGYALRMNHTELFDDKKLFIEFQNTTSVSIGIPFFHAFRTMFNHTGNEMAFLPKNLSETTKIINVRGYTTDDDFLFKEHLGQVFGVILGIITVLGLGLYIFVFFWKKNIKNEYSYIVKLDNLLKSFLI